MDNEYNRIVYLLQAAYNLINKQNDSGYVLNILEETVNYDGSDCDGYCLLDDIKDALYALDLDTDEFSGEYNLEA